MNITIEFSTKNAAFEDDFRGEVQRVLKKVYKDILLNGEDVLDGLYVKDHYRIFDINGNTIGKLTIASED